MGGFFLFGLSKKQTYENGKHEFVTVVVAVRNEENNIKECLHHLKNQIYPSDLYEVIVIDDSSVDGTIKVAEEFAAGNENFFIYRLQHYIPGYSPKKQALNLGIEKSRGEIILTTDADCKVGEKWISSMVSRYEKNTGMVAGFSLVEETQKKNLLNIFQRFDFLSLLASAAACINNGITFSVTGQNLSYRKKAFLDVGGFKEIYHRISGDDVLLMQLISKKTKWKIVFNFNPDSFVKTKGEATLGKFINQRKRWASNAKTQVINKAFFFYLIDVLVFNSFMLTGFIISFFKPDILSFIVPFLLLKFLIELTVTYKACRIFWVPELFKFFPVWFLVEIPYIVVMGFVSIFGKFTWKEREFKL